MELPLFTAPGTQDISCPFIVSFYLVTRFQPDGERRSFSARSEQQNCLEFREDSEETTVDICPIYEIPIHTHSRHRAAVRTDSMSRQPVSRLGGLRGNSKTCLTHWRDSE